jgi:TetR/AcrR family transcriptional repressor of nem operon
MRVNREEAEKNRKRVVSTAGALFRERGFDGIGIADLMKEAGLTHGGFYKQFASKQHLQAEACAGVLAENTARWSEIIEAGDKPFETLLNFYLSSVQHRADKTACAMATLGTDAARQGGTVRSVFTRGIEAHLQQLQEILPGDTETEKRRHAMTALAEMVGALILARAVDDRTLAGELLDTARDDLAGRFKG